MLRFLCRRSKFRLGPRFQKNARPPSLSLHHFAAPNFSVCGSLLWTIIHFWPWVTLVLRKKRYFFLIFSNWNPLNHFKGYKLFLFYICSALLATPVWRVFQIPPSTYSAYKSRIFERRENWLRCRWLVGTIRSSMNRLNSEKLFHGKRVNLYLKMRFLSQNWGFFFSASFV